MERKYSKIPNDLLEALTRAGLTGREFRYILFIARKTYGFHKAQDWIANKQFVKATGISRANISHIQKALLLRKIVVKNNNKIKINDNFGLWIAPKRKKTLIVKDDNVVKDDNRVLSKTTPTKETITKERERGSLYALKDYYIALLKERGLKYAGGLKDIPRLAEVLATRSPTEIKEIFEFYLSRKEIKVKVLSINASLSSYSLALYDEEKKKKDWQYQ